MWCISFQQVFKKWNTIKKPSYLSSGSAYTEGLQTQKINKWRPSCVRHFLWTAQRLRLEIWYGNHPHGLMILAPNLAFLFHHHCGNLVSRIPSMWEDSTCFFFQIRKSLIFVSTFLRHLFCWMKFTVLFSDRISKEYCIEDKKLNKNIIEIYLHLELIYL